MEDKGIEINYLGNAKYDSDGDHLKVSKSQRGFHRRRYTTSCQMISYSFYVL